MGDNENKQSPDTIPRKMDQVVNYLAKSTEGFAKIITREQNTLDVMKGQVVQKQIVENIEPANIKDKTMLLNKEGGNKSPCYYCFRDYDNNGIIWFIPISLEKLLPL